ncbi:MAG TPA: succinate dehydrogenase [Nitrososphaerales archaeon]|nr:succinate dehydrogenase [Nitrososphaerales archaeon]
MTDSRENRRGLRGWLDPYHFNLERWAYVFQRVTGLGILAYVLGHIGDTSFFIGGPFGSGPSPTSWAGDLSITENLIGHTILVAVVLIVVYHGVNGIRLIMAEYGIIFQKPSRPEYPYKAKGLRTLQQHMIWLAIILAIVGALWAGTILF